MKIFFVGGGTGGPTAPILAVAAALKRLEPGSELFFVGTGTGKLARRFLDDSGVSFRYLSVPAGKWRRYFSVMNFIDIFKLAAGFLKSWYLLGKYRPDIVFGAGSFVQVPVMWAAYLRGVPVVAHQQDLVLLMSTRLVAPFAKRITASLDLAASELPEFSGLFRKVEKSKIVVTGNPVRSEILTGSKKEAVKFFHLIENFPTILIVGGGTGAESLNRVVFDALPELIKYFQVIHVTGGKVGKQDGFKNERYHQYDFLGHELPHAYAAADIVVSRGGMSTITELSALGKVAVIVPLPDSAQEENGRFLAFMKCAVVVFQEFLTPNLLLQLTRKILWNHELRSVLSKNLKGLVPPKGDEKIAKLLIKINAESRKQ